MVKKTAVSLAAWVVAGVVASLPASAAVIYQSISNLSAAPSFNPQCDQCTSNGQNIGENFTLGSGASVGSVLLDVSNGYAWPTSVTLSIFADSAGNTLGTEAFNETFSTFASDVNTGNGTDIIGVNTPGLSLAAGTYDAFWDNPNSLGISGYDAMGAGTGIYELVGTGAAPATGNTYSYVGPSDDEGIALQSNAIAIPEPATWTMFLVGFGAVGFILHGSRRKQSAVAGAQTPLTPN
jgi:hypothetical protein